MENSLLFTADVLISEPEEIEVPTIGPESTRPKYTFEDFVKNRKGCTLIVGWEAMARHGLVSGYNAHLVWTFHEEADNCPCEGNVTLSHYHFADDYQLKEISPRLYLPSEERCIVDCIYWQKKNYDEGFLIEALQTYQSRGHKPEDLFEVADHYGVSHDDILYWWKEAEEDTEMSMG